MDLNKVIATVNMIGSNLPAFIALMEQVKTLFGETDQKKLQAAIVAADAAADEAHRQAQAL